MPPAATSPSGWRPTVSAAPELGAAHAGELRDQELLVGCGARHDHVPPLASTATLLFVSPAPAMSCRQAPGVRCEAEYARSEHRNDPSGIPIRIPAPSSPRSTPG